MSSRFSRPGRQMAQRSKESQSESASWQRTLVVVWFTELISLIGFSMVMPFLPFYVEELGVTDPNQVKYWSGLIVSAQAVTMAIFAPIWGSLADRYGRKPMLERAIFGGSIILTLMGFVQTPQQLLVLRLIQGCLTGTVPAATALVAGIVPRERTGFALGWLQMGVFAGVSVGPLVGGLIADSLGIQTSFLVTGACLFVSGLGVLFFVHESFKRPEPKPGGVRSHWWDGAAMVLRSRDLQIVLGARFLTRTGARIIGPILPLFVAVLMPESSRVATMAGIVTGVSAAASSAGAVVLGRTGDRIGYRRVLLTSAVAAAVLYIPQAMVTNIAQLILLQFFVGVALAGTISSLEALLATQAPEGQQGAVFGVSSSVMSASNALGPMLGASVAIALSNRATFMLAGAVFMLAAVLTGLFLPDYQPGADSLAEPIPASRGRQAKVVKTR
jgi:DHA1 family multidrug resistance protein-like MFS transporter